MKKLLLCLLGFAFTNTNAQTADKMWSIGLHGGATQYNGDIGNDFYKTDEAFYGFGGISFSRYIADRMDLNLLVTKGEVGFDVPEGYFRQQINTATLNFRFNFLKQDAFMRPYLFVGGGMIMFDKNVTADGGKIDWAAPSFGAGVNVKLGESTMLNLQEMFMYSTGDDKDGVVGNTNDAYLFHTVGFSFNFGSKKDADNDGVADRKDKCPDTPTGISVDGDGCPVDKDKDGVADYKDDCPEVAGDPSVNGCPDKDKDAVADTKDDCPDIAGEVSLKGCPDKDKDGISDKDDRCPELAGPAELKGCPDKDFDGVADLDDKCPDSKPGFKVDLTGCPMDDDKDGLTNENDSCPDIAGLLAMKGCPDNDSDGVSDKEDRCPTLKGTIANKGCPEMSKADIKKITQIASKIYFEFDKADLKAVSLPQLDNLVVILNKYPEANLTIEGHTDNVGDDTYNLQLSQRRTESVKTYLASKGIFDSRLTAIGFGETKPVADNKTKAGQAQNRRVELKTSY